MKPTELIKFLDPMLLQDCLDDFIPKARRASWSVHCLSVDVFSGIYSNLALLLSGTAPGEIVCLEDHWPHLRSMQLRSKLSYLVELYLTAETSLRDTLLFPRAKDVAASEGALLFEEVNGAFHILIEQELPACCDDCIAPLRERFQNMREHGETVPPEVLETLSVEHVLQKEDRIIPCPLPDDLPKSGSAKLAAFLTDIQPELLDLWTTRVETPSFSSCLVSLKEAVVYSYDVIQFGIAGDRRRAHRLLQEAPHLGRHHALQLCLVGEESVASLLALRFDGDELQRAQARRAVNQAFHALMRGLIHAECSRCAGKLARVTEALSGAPAQLQTRASQ